MSVNSRSLVDKVGSREDPMPSWSSRDLIESISDCSRGSGDAVRDGSGRAWSSSSSTSPSWPGDGVNGCMMSDRARGGGSWTMATGGRRAFEPELMLSLRLTKIRNAPSGHVT